MNIYALFVVVIFGNICVNCVASEQKNFRNIKQVNIRKVHAGNSVDDFELQAPSTVTFKCPFPWGHYPVPKECSSYYNCSFSKVTKEKCPDDQHFDKLSLKCRNKDEATCADKNIFPDKITYKCTKSWGSSAYDKDCSVYYLCLSRKPFMKQCEWNELYDAIKNKCQNKDNVDCGSRPNPYGSLKCGSEQKPFAVPDTHCKEYYICEQGQLRQRTCPDNQLFDKNSLICEYEELVKECEIPLLSKCPKPDGQFVKPGTYCQKYLDCKNGIAFEKSCPINEIFNEELGSCDCAEYTQCEDRDLSCPESNGIFLVKGTECKVYATCVNGKANFKMCPEKQAFDEFQKECDWKELVTCEDSEGTTAIDESTSDSLETTFTGLPDTTTATILNTIETTKISEITTQKETSEVTQEGTDTTAIPETTKQEEISTTAVSGTTMQEEISTTKYPVTFEETESEDAISLTHNSPTPNKITDEITETEMSRISTSQILNNTKPVTAKSTPIEVTTLTYRTSSPRGCVFGDESCQPDPVLCPEKQGEFPHPDVSTIFIHCDHWRPYIKKCPEELHFDPVLKVCDWPKH